MSLWKLDNGIRMILALIISMLLPVFSVILLCPPAAAKEQPLKPTDKATAFPLAAFITTSTTSFTNETIHDLVVHFTLKNVGHKNIDPELPKTELVIDGKPLKESALLFGSGPRDSRFSDLPPGDKLEFSYPLGHYIQEPGIHSFVWRGKGFDDSKLTIKVVREDNPWKTVASGPWIRVAVERDIYKMEGNQHFFVHVRIDNLCDKTLGFDCTDRFVIFYPNQWAEANIPRRQLISETRRSQNELTPAEKQNLIDMYCDTVQKTGKKLVSEKNGKKHNMIKVARHSSYDYFISFNSGGYEKAEAVKLAYMIVVMDGRMGFTDGKTVQTVRRDMNDSIAGEVPLATPVKVRPMPRSANVLFGD